MKKFNIAVAKLLVYALIIVIIIIGIGFLFPSSTRRNIKSMVSDYTGGLNRTITLYDYNGNKIKSWTGRFDVDDNESRVFFDDEDGKRVIIYNGIVVNEEN
jgi:hypothetical protein